MKKILLTLAATAMCTGAFAGTRILYQQNFETANDPADLGWSYGGESMKIASDDWGKFLELYQGTQNGRSGFVKWGDQIYLDENGNSVLEDGIYTAKFDFSIKTNSTNQFNTEITLFTNGDGVSNQPWRGRWGGTANPNYNQWVYNSTKDIIDADPVYNPWNNWIADIFQTNTAADTDMTAVINAPYKKGEKEGCSETDKDVAATNVTIGVDTSDSKTLTTGAWYTFTSEVNVNTREVKYSVVDLSGTELTSGTFTVPETSLESEEYPVSMYAQGLWIMTARYQTTIYIDNIEISYESEKDVANPPTIALTGIGKDADDNLNLNLRTYTITFINGETLHVTGTDGTTEEVEFADCDGNYVYTTSTSGTLKAWTTYGTATSEVVEMEVECVPCVLPTATATISSVTSGYGKSYTLGVDNTSVPLQPTIFINYEFVGKSGNKISEEGVASGYVVNVEEEGTLKLTTESYGYQAATVEVVNNREFAEKKVYDFARMSDSDLSEAGFSTWSVLNSGNTSGFNNWTARKRLFYYDINQPTGEVDDNGNPTYVSVLPFGFVAEDNTTNVIEYSEVAADAKAHTDFFSGLDIFPANRNVCFMKHIGLYNNETTNNFNSVKIEGIDQTDFVLVNTIDNYGGDSNHPIVATADEYYSTLAGTDAVYTPNLLPVTIEFGGKSSTVTAEVNEETGKYDLTYNLFRIQTALTKITIFNQIGGPIDDAVEGIEAEVAGDGYYYTIDGMRLAEPTRPGLYIHNGKKIIVK